jgi:hydrogenase small subunit
MKISRRDFLKWSIAATVALKLNYDLDRLNMVLADDSDPPVIWLQGSGCTGCTVSLFNVTNPATIDTVLTDKISMKFNSTVMASADDSALSALENAALNYQGQFILVVEGAVPTGANGNYCILGESNGTNITMQSALLKYAPMAKYVVAAGTCAAFGGIPASAPNNTQSASVLALVKNITANPVVNLPSCPVHPTVIVQTLLDLILTGTPTLDSNNRPTTFYSKTIHSLCSRRSLSRVSQPGLVGCFRSIGCQGPNSIDNFCPSQQWNNGQNWCINSNYPCIGCANISFPTNPLTQS